MLTDPTCLVDEPTATVATDSAAEPSSVSTPLSGSATLATPGQDDGMTDAPCPKCGHGDDDHRRESWYDEEGIEGMTCAACEDAGRLCSWWTWDWAEVVAQTAMHQGDDEA